MYRKGTFFILTLIQKPENSIIFAGDETGNKGIF
jgi:hypothetical protein